MDCKLSHHDRSLREGKGGIAAQVLSQTKGEGNKAGGEEYITDNGRIYGTQGNPAQRCAEICPEWVKGNSGGWRL